LRGRTLRISGSGPDGNGALIATANGAVSAQDYIELVDDATINLGAYYIFVGNSLKLNGHCLTVKSTGGKELYFYQTLTAGKVVLDAATLSMRGKDAAFAANEDGTIEMKNGSIVDFVNSGAVSPKPMELARPLLVSGMGTIRTASNNADTFNFGTNCFRFTQPIMFNPGSTDCSLTICPNYNAASGLQFNFFGPITGTGDVTVGTASYYNTGRVYLANTNNAFTGKFSFTGSNGGRLLAGGPRSLGGDGTSYTNVTVTGSSTKTAFVDCEVAEDAAEGRWDWAHYAKLVNEGVFGSHGFARLAPEFCEGVPELPCAGGATNKIGAAGEVALRFADAAAARGDFKWAFGTVHLRAGEPIGLEGFKLYSGRHDVKGESVPVRAIFDGGTTVQIGETPFIVGENDNLVASNMARLVVRNASILSTNATRRLSPGTTSQDAIVVRGILEVGEGAVVSNKLVVGSHSLTNAPSPWSDSSCGAVYQTGGQVYSLGGSSLSYLDASVGLNGRAFGGYEKQGGAFTAYGNFSISAYGMGTWTQYGGATEFKAHETAGGGSRGIAMGNGGWGVLAVLGGSFSSEGFTFGSTYQNSGFVNAVFSGEGTEALIGNGSIQPNGDFVSARSYVAVNDGAKLTANYLYSRGNPCWIGFNGGIFETGNNGAEFFSYSGATGKPTRITVYEKGVDFRVNVNTAYISKPIERAVGQGVKSVTMDAPFAAEALYASPIVKIEGDGQGAAAIALFDTEMGAVTNILVTQPGVEYTVASTIVYVASKSVTKTYPCVLGDNPATGPFTKSGTGTLYLQATNTWGGATVVNGGTLVQGVAAAIPTNTAVELRNGGVLDLGNLGGKISSITYGAGGGSVIRTEGATLPGQFSMTIGIDEILAGRAIALPGDAVNLDGITLTITGDVSKLTQATELKYTIVTAGGALIGTPNIVCGPLPGQWKISTNGKRIVLFNQRGTIVVFR